MNIDVYPVGWLAALQKSRRFLTMPHPGGSFSRRFWFHPLRSEWTYCRAWAAAGNWRAVRMSLNGYIAEPDTFPDGDYRRRCGTGWTRARAIRSLHRRLPHPTDQKRL